MNRQPLNESVQTATYPRGTQLRNDLFIDANKDNIADGVFCAVERFDGSGVTANAVLTVDT